MQDTILEENGSELPKTAFISRERLWLWYNVHLIQFRTKLQFVLINLGNIFVLDASYLSINKLAIRK